MKKVPDLSLQSAHTELITIYWKIIQWLIWATGLAILAFLFFMPQTGVTLVWNVLIPVAPALLVIGTGVWRNICPISTTALLPDKLGWSLQIKLSGRQRSVLNLIGVIILLAVVPLRHVTFNRNAESTLIVLTAIGAVAFIAGFLFERKSGWCSGLCPIHPVEKLYGTGVAFTLPNAHCEECVKCSVPCPDSTSNASIQTAPKTWTQTAVEYMVAGGFPGFIWGWFQVPDYVAGYGWNHLSFIYGIPLMGGITTMIIYYAVRQVLSHNGRKILVNIFAATAISCYYWFRLPQLFGFRVHYTNSTLIDLTNVLPAYTPWIMNILTTTFFFWWMVFRTKVRRSWAVRPKYAV